MAKSARSGNPACGLLRYGRVALALTLALQMKSAAAVDVGSCDNTGMGHLTAPSLSPGHILRPSSLFTYPDPSLKGTLSIATDFHWGNVWTYDPDRYLIDGEWIRWNTRVCYTRVCYTLEDALSVGVLIPVAGRSGGFADPLIETPSIWAMHPGTSSRRTSVTSGLQATERLRHLLRVMPRVSVIWQHSLCYTTPGHAQLLL